MSQAITDALTRHQIYLQRYATGRVQNALPFVRRLANRLRARILEGGMTEFQLQRLQILYADILRLTAETSAAIEAQLTLGLDELASHEAEFAHKILAGAVTVETAKASPELIRAAITTKPMRLLQGDEVVSVTIQDAFRQFGGAVARDVRQSVQAGIVEGKTTQQIAREVHGMVTSRSRRQAEALVRTATNHVGNTARAEVFGRNSDIITEEKWVSTLDGRTSILCASRDSKVFPVGQGPYPPAHYNAVAQGVMIETLRGSVPIQDVMVGDMVLTHKGRYKPVTAVMRKPIDSAMLKIEDLSGRVVFVTEDHPMLTDNGWVNAGELKCGVNLFQNLGKRIKFINWPSVVKRNSEDFPSIFDCSEVFSEVAIKPGSMASSINLDCDKSGFVGKIPDAVIGNELAFKARDFVSSKEVRKANFSKGWGLLELLRKRLKNFAF